jgi:hypothetical protein
MRTRDDLKAMVEPLRGGHSLLAAYLEAVHQFDRQAVGKTAAIVDLAPDAKLPASARGGNSVAPGLLDLASA